MFNMFDLSFPALVEGGLGNSVICAGEKHESCQIFMPTGFDCLDLIRMWFAEASAVSRGRRMRGVLPTQIDRDRKGHLGCVAGWVMVRGKEGVHLHDCANFPLEERTRTRMFKISPENWWRCIHAEYWKGTRGVFVVSPASLGLWAERLFTLLHAVDATVDLQDYKRYVKDRNAGLVSADLRAMPGGADLFGMFPPDFVDRMSFVKWDKHSADGLADEGSAANFELDMESCPKRTKETLIRWIKNEFRRNRMPVLLMPQSQGGVAVATVEPGDDVGAQLSNLAKLARIKGKTLDYVLFSTSPELLRDCGPMRLSRREYRSVLKGVDQVLLGVCKGTAWVCFPVRQEKDRDRR